jgi:hypothetical protein
MYHTLSQGNAEVNIPSGGVGDAQQRSAVALEQNRYRAHLGTRVWRELKRALDSLTNLARHIAEVGLAHE